MIVHQRTIHIIFFVRLFTLSLAFTAYLHLILSIPLPFNLKTIKPLTLFDMLGPYVI